MYSTMKKDCWDDNKLPPPAVADYAPRGSWKSVQDFNTYVTGSSESPKALVIIHDAFGPSMQIEQGADRMAEQIGATILMPDLFKGNRVSHDEYAKDPAVVRVKVKEWMALNGDYDQTAAVMVTFTQAAKEQYPSATSWGVFGLCWGGKIAVLASLTDNCPFTVSGQTHPAGLNVEDAKAMTIPHICLASKDEPADIVAEYRAILERNGRGRVETFDKSIHGWMGGRADLTDSEQKFEYERGYTIAAKFFAQNMS